MVKLLLTLALFHPNSTSAATFGSPAVDIRARPADLGASAAVSAPILGASMPLVPDAAAALNGAPVSPAALAPSSEAAAASAVMTAGDGAIRVKERAIQGQGLDGSARTSRPKQKNPALDELVETERKARLRSDDQPHVTVIGAGFAGLSAAKELEDRGAKVTLFERNPQAGGRALSVPYEKSDGSGVFFQDLGPQFVVSHYDRIWRLIRDTGLSGEALELPSSLSAVRDGLWRKIDFSDPMTIYHSGLLGAPAPAAPFPTWTALNPFSYLAPHLGLAAALTEMTIRKFLQPSVQAGRQIVSGFRTGAEEARGLSPVRYRDWGSLDHASASDWSDRNYGRAGTDYLMQPYYAALFFQPLEDVSAAQAEWMIANMDRGDKFYVLKRGMQSLAAAVAGRLADVRYKTEVTSVRKEENGKIRVDTNNGSHLTDAVIIAVPPPLAAGFLKEPSPLQKQLMANDYASTIVVNLNFPNGLRKGPGLNGVPSAMIPRVEGNGPVVSLSIESMKRKSIGRNEVLGLHMIHRAARQMMDMGWTDEKIAATAIRDLARHIPGLKDADSHAIVQRWEHAVPRPRAGWARFLDQFWREQEGNDSMIVFVGDGTTFGTFGAAAESGVEGADLILKRLPK